MKALIKLHIEKREIWGNNEKIIKSLNRDIRSKQFSPDETKNMRAKVRALKKDHDAAKMKWDYTGKYIHDISIDVKKTLMEVDKKYGTECVRKIIKKPMFDEIQKMIHPTTLEPLFHMISPRDLRWTYRVRKD